MNTVSTIYFDSILVLLFITLTLMSDGIPVITKTVGLLLTSFLVVLLWISQTAFLFIYLVYILAFISAVLMLFLSVVLMLPITNLTV